MWLADNWNPTQPTNWVTLPSNTDPRLNDGTDDTTDRYGDGTGLIISCKWVDNDRLMVLIRARRGEGGDSAVLLCRRKPEGTWERIVISEHSNKKSDYENGNIEQPTSRIMPPLGPWSDLAIHDPAPANTVQPMSRLPATAPPIAWTHCGGSMARIPGIRQS